MPAYDVFVSYSSRDQAIADAAVAALEAQGLRCWVAPRDIVPGQEWSDAIISGLDQCRLMVLIFSGNSNASHQVIREVERAVNKGLAVVPFRIENLKPSRAMEYFISHSHWLDAYQPPLDDHLEKLTQTAKALLTGALPPAEPAKDLGGRLRAAARSLLARDRRIGVLVGLTAVMVLIAVAVVVLMFALRTPTASPELIQVKAETELLVEKVRQIDPRQGFAAMQEAIDGELKVGQGLFAQNQFALAAASFRGVLEKARQLQDDDRQRQEAKAELTTAEAAKLEARQNKVAELVPSLLADAEKKLREGAEAFEAGRFGDARQAWRQAAQDFGAARAASGQFLPVKAARETYEELLKRPVYKEVPADDVEAWNRVRARAEAAEKATAERRIEDAVRAYGEARDLLRRAALPRVKGLAFWAGFATETCSWAANREARVKEYKFGVGVDPRGLPPGDELLRRCRKVLDEECRPQLEIKGDVLARMLAATDPEAWTSLGNEFARGLRDAHGLEARNSYYLGVMLATLHDNTQSAKTYGEGSIFLGGRNPMLASGHLVWATRHAYGAGCPDEVLEPLTQTSRSFAKELGKGTAVTKAKVVADAGESLQPLHGKLMPTPGDAAALFRKPRALPQGTPEQVAAMQQLTDLGAEFYFGGLKYEPTGVEFAGRLAEPDRVLESLKVFRTLTWVDAAGNAVTDAGLAHLEGMTRLTELFLYDTRVTEAGLVHLRGLTNLKNLSLSGLPITDEGLKQLEGLTNLEELHLRRSPVTDEGVARLKKTLPGVVVKR